MSNLLNGYEIKLTKYLEHSLNNLHILSTTVSISEKVYACYVVLTDLEGGIGKLLLWAWESRGNSGSSLLKLRPSFQSF